MLEPIPKGDVEVKRFLLNPSFVIFLKKIKAGREKKEFGMKKSEILYFGHFAQL